MSVAEERRRDQDNRNVVVATVAGLYAYLRKSFLLSFATFGLLLIVMGGAIAPISNGELTNVVAGLLGASGFVIFVLNIIGYGIYSVIRRRY